MTGGATFSLDRAYRYRLWRDWDASKGRCAFIGVNPSTANETDSDHTIAKEVGFAQRWGFGGIVKVNLFGLVSTDVTGLLRATDPVGPDNDDHLSEVISSSKRIVWCWGKHPPRVKSLVAKRLFVLSLTEWWVHMQRGKEVGTFGRNGDGSPRHPLMLPYSTPFVINPTC